MVGEAKNKGTQSKPRICVKIAYFLQDQVTLYSAVESDTHPSSASYRLKGQECKAAIQFEIRDGA